MKEACDLFRSEGDVASRGVCVRYDKAMKPLSESSAFNIL